MEKLQPLITHRFWVLFGLAVLVPFVSWFIYNGTMAESIQGREDTLKSEFSKSTKGGDSPNTEFWINPAAELNALHEEDYKEAAAKLWLDQQNGTAMFWPKSMLPYVQETPFGQPLDGTDGLTIYKDVYPKQHAEDVLSQIDTYSDGKGLCEVNTPMIHVVPPGTWTGLPNSDQMWHAQEDEWLVAQLLQSINKVNTDAGVRSITEAPIRQLHELQLFGGNLDVDPKKAKKSGGGYPGAGKSRAAAMGGGGSMMSGGSGMLEGGAPTSGGRGGGGGASAIASPSIGVKEEEEFGSPVDTSKKSAKKKKGPGGSRTGGMTGMGTSSGPLRRYVHNKKDDKFRTRGFKVQVTIMQDKLPTLLAELTNSKWPVEIVRVHWEASNEGGRRATPLNVGGSLTGSGRSNGYPPAKKRQASAGFGGMLSGGSTSSAGSQAGSSSAGYSRGEETADSPANPLEAALADPNLSTVVIAGLITIFKVSDEEAEAMRESVKAKTASEDMQAAGADMMAPKDGDEAMEPGKEGMTEQDKSAASPADSGAGTPTDK